MRFEVLARDPGTGARLGRLHTPHGVVATPAFMPVGTVGTVKGMTQDELERLGVQILLGNTYHLYLRPGHEIIREFGGLHRFMSWPHPILTDSGGFQIMSLKGLTHITEDGVRFRSHLDGSPHFFTPERAVEVQLALGSDIMMVLDECVEFPSTHEATRRAMKLTGRWARRAKEFYQAELGQRRDSGLVRDSGSASESGAASSESRTGRLRIGGSEAQNSSLTNPEPRVPNPGTFAHSGLRTSDSPTLFGIVQGGTDKDLRRESAEEMQEIGFEGYAIGGLSVGEPKGDTYEIAEYTARLLPEDRPRYLMGVGTPADLLECVARGVDMFDCVMPTRNARNAGVFTSEGKLVIKSARYARDESPLDPACECLVCRRYSRSYLRHLFTAGEMLGAILATHHNLHFYLDTMGKIRQAIRAGLFGKLWSRARSGGS